MGRGHQTSFLIPRSGGDRLERNGRPEGASPVRCSPLTLAPSAPALARRRTPPLRGRGERAPRSALRQAGRQGQEQRPGLIAERQHVVVAAEGGRSLVLRVDQEREGGDLGGARAVHRLPK